MHTLETERTEDEIPTRKTEPMALAELKAKIREVQRELDTTMVNVERNMYSAMADASKELDELLATLEESGAA